MLLGAHVSIQGGVELAPARAKALGCDVMQIFSKNQMQWKVPTLAPEAADAFKAGVKAAELGPTLVHCSYLLNLASPDDALWEKSIGGLVAELDRAEALGIPYVTFHPGSPKDKGMEWGVKRVGEGVTKALEATKGAKAMVLLETNAGQGAQVGRTFLELAGMLDNVTSQKERVGVCFDTCHVFVSGYPLHTREGYDDAFSTFDNEVGLQNLKAFHLNDSKAEFDSKRDRHENIGEGKLGLETFRWLMDDKRFATLPGYLETPAPERYAEQIALLRSLAE